MTPDSTAAYVSTRQIGDASVSIISDGRFPWAPALRAPETEWRRAMPEANAVGEIIIELDFVHIQLGASSIVVDLGFNDATPDDKLPSGLVRTPGLVAGLASLGVRPDQVTHVAITHAHGDHFEGATTHRDGAIAPRFPNARYFIGQSEWAGNPMRSQPESTLTIAFGALERLGALELVDSDREIAPGVTLLHAPGESPGHSVVRVRSGEQCFFYLGDLVHHTCEVEHREWVSPGRNQASVVSSRERIFAEVARPGTLCVFTHRAFPGWGRIVQANSGYRWEDA